MRFRRHVPDTALPSVPLRGIGRELVILLLIFAGAFIAAFIYLSPGPIMASERATTDVIGMSSDEAQAVLEEQGFKVKRAESRMHPIYDPGKVIWQDPPAGTVMPQSSIVSLTVSDGIAEYPVPDVAQLPLEVASRVVTAGGFRMGTVDTIPAAGPPGVVVDVRPAIGSLQALGSPIQLVVTVPPRRALPDEVIGPPHGATP